MQVNRIILAVHGVRSHGEWGEVLHDRLLKAGVLTDDVLYDTLDAPWIPALIGWGFSWLPFLRHYYTNWMSQRLRELSAWHPHAVIDVVAHSYGTWLVHYAVERSDSDQQSQWPILRLRRFILIASVLKEHKPWSMLDTGQIGHVINHFSRNDLVLSTVPPPFGHAGLLGFTMKNPRLRQCQWLLDHVNYWQDEPFWSALLEQLQEPEAAHADAK